ncbi:STAS domain-containing protein [Streptomyces kaniharaensis]|uniref:Anti-sigma factor antagonist n=1 Tax=Streptomyces kaniharaensis TaxID=212423 RepID=A0A6N7KZ88_9ACTN|nr:STAS domain-containing protein [Streptomyces kaniharaensis]MQS16860.1 STAS domain-containing protein [Streptomyces kaniharaensis]
MPGPAEDSTASRGERGLRVTVEREGPVRILTLAGELDHDTADGLRAALARPADDGLERIVVDLGALQFCDSTGLNILLRARLDTETAGVRLEIAGPRPVVARLFAVTGADAVLRIHPDLGSALKAPDPAPDPHGDAPPNEPA